MNAAAPRSLLIPLLIATQLLLGAILPAQAGGTSTRRSSAGMRAEQLLPLTVREAWEKSGKNHDRFREMVRTLAAYSAQKRGITVPNTREAGRAVGSIIRKRAEADPDQLLYSVVDGAIRSYRRTQGSTPRR